MQSLRIHLKCERVKIFKSEKKNNKSFTKLINYHTRGTMLKGILSLNVLSSNALSWFRKGAGCAFSTLVYPNSALKMISRVQNWACTLGVQGIFNQVLVIYHKKPGPMCLVVPPSASQSNYHSLSKTLSKVLFWYWLCEILPGLKIYLHLRCLSW